MLFIRLPQSRIQWRLIRYPEWRTVLQYHRLLVVRGAGAVRTGNFESARLLSLRHRM